MYIARHVLGRGRLEDYGEWKAVPGIDASKLLVSSNGWVRVRTRGQPRKLGNPTRGTRLASSYFGVSCAGKHRVKRRQPNGVAWGYKFTPASSAASGYVSTLVGRKTTYLMHRIVLQTFAGVSQDPSANTVDHRNHIRHDNRLSNLRWATRSEQIKNQRR